MDLLNRKTVGVWLAASFLSLVLGCPAKDASAAAQMDETASPRTIIAIYDATSEAEPRTSRIHRFIELPLNHLGYRVLYVDVDSLNRHAIVDEDVAAIVTWFDRPPQQSEKYIEWASAALREGPDPAGLKMIALGDVGTGPHADPDQAAAYLDRLGLEAAGPEQRLGVWSRIDASNPEMIGFECDFLISPGKEPSVRARSDRAKSHLRVKFDAGADATTDLVVTADRGGYASSAALVKTDEFGLSRWIIDPFAFFGTILSTGPHPVPDTTTLNGRRVFFSTVYGEGWTKPAPSDSLQDIPTLAGQIVLNELIQPFPSLPVSLAIASGDLDPTLNGAFAETGASLARAVFALPQVEAASNTRTLPARWGFFANYRRDAELAEVDRLVRGRSANDRGLVTGTVSNLVRVFAADTAYVAQGGDAPRRYMQQPFDLFSEIEGSLGDVGALVAGGEPAKLLAWSGDALVFEEALKAAREAGAEAIGGGGGVIDATMPSISGLTPLSVPVGNEHQIYDALSGDSAYTNFWSAPAYGYRRLAQTLEATEHPRRLKPFHLSYSGYSALQFGLRNAVLSNLVLAEASPIAPLHASDYAKIVRGFLTARLVTVGARTWRIENRGALQTLRVDAAGAEALDLARSEGVLGAVRHDDALYVALDPAAEAPTVALALSDAATGVVAGGEFSLEQSRWMIRDLSQSQCSAEFEATGHGAGEMSWLAQRPGSYRIEMYLGGDSRPAYWETVTAGDDLRLSATLPSLAIEPVRVIISGC